jgi:hypothetical protein
MKILTMGLAIALLACNGNTISAPQSGGRALNHDEKELVGPWKGGGNYSGIDRVFEFRADGSYSYNASEGSAWRLGHEGEFRIRVSRLNPAHRILALKPTRITAEPSLAGQLKLEKYTFMDNSEREYEISDPPGNWPAPTKALVDVDRASNGVPVWFISRNDPKYRP